MDYYFFGFMLILFGVIILIGVNFELGWFINYYRNKEIFRILGKKGARVLYTLLAIILIIGGIWAIRL
jgi:hypothetical protein